MRIILFFFFVLQTYISAFGQVSPKTMHISGFVKDFNERPIDSADVFLLNRFFKPVVQTLTDSTGYYILRFQEDAYHALAAIKMSDYGKSRVEYWAWRVPAVDSLTVNPRYHRLEVYGVNAFSVQGSGSRSVFIYFRPMSLTRYKKWESLHDTTGAQMEIIGPALTAKDITVTIDGQPSDILDITELKEKAKSGSMRAYLMQCTLPEMKKLNHNARIVVIVTDPENQDKGEALLFWQVE
ncbi:MAG: carboxypeptidase regulatory-like domain-containing protein [Bacteroidetes bacterium]|nr:carboxypeptidase regulatory-like domain-containing protein [Bacteroidota bacterium]